MNINYKSDFVIKVSFSEKLTAFKLLFRTSGQKGYTAELKDDGTTTNCKVSDKDVYVVFKDHFLGVGQLAMELVSWRTDVNFDGVPLKNVVPSTETIYLIDGLSDGVTEAEVSTAINYAVISSYTMAKANGYSGTEADYNVYLATLPQVVGTASDNNTAYENAEGIRKSNENARTANEETRVNAESLRNGNENDRKSVEALRVNNESSRSSAENTRTANESVRISNENSRILHEDERIESEGKRVIAETSRVNAEQSRVAEFSTLKQASETATTNAETAAQNVKDGNTPILRVGASGNWEVSYDNGASYTDCGTKAQGDKGDKGDLGAAAAVVQAVSSSTTDVPSCNAVKTTVDPILDDVNNNVLRKSIDGTLDENLITSGTTFTNGKYVVTTGNNVADYASLSYCSVPVVAGKTYRFTCYVNDVKSGFVCRVLNSAGTYIVEQSTSPYFNHIVALGNNIIEITIPTGGVTLQTNLLITQQSTAIIKQLYGNTDKLPIGWLEVNEDNCNEDLKNKINNPQISDISAGQINGDFTILSSETLTGYSYSSGGYIKQASDTQIQTVTSSYIHSAIITPVAEGNTFLVSMGLIVDPSGANASDFFVFGKTETVPAIKISEIQNYVTLYDETNKIYKIVIPKDCTIFYLTMKDSAQSTSFIKKCVTKKTLDWLEVEEKNIPSTITESIESSVKTTIDSDQVSEEANYHLWNSVNKPIAFSTKKLIAFGDSITAGTSSPGLVSLVDTNYISLFCSHVGAVLTNYAVGGSTITDNGSEYAICKRVVEYATSSFDIVWIAGGTNDYNQNMPLGTFGSTDQTNFYGALRAICEHLKNNCPNAVVVFVTPIPYTNAIRNTKTEIQKLDSYRSAIYDIATLYGYNVVDGKNLGMPKTSGNWNNAMIDDSDGCHPTKLGHSLLAKLLSGKLV